MRRKQEGGGKVYMFSWGFEDDKVLGYLELNSEWGFWLWLGFLWG